MIGSRIGHFEVVAKLGEGGMGEVYEAVDTELDRKVAVKALPEEMAADAERLERFRREAKAIAALNHPSIVTIHSVEKAKGQRFLIMEKVEGKSLDREIPQDGFALDNLLEIAIPIADALATTHDQGIIHRDLKPANVMVTLEGRVKLLDFGLAKLTEAPVEPEPAAGGEDETKTALLTREGAVIGTAPYMSPEQLRGEEVDTRSDVFSLGTMLYEMATGRRPFQGTSSVELASSILKDQPPSIVAVREELPRQLGRIVESCLEKDPDRRFQTARDVRNQLEALKQETMTGVQPASLPDSATRRTSPLVWLVAALAVLAIGAGGLVLFRLRPAAEAPATKPIESLATLLDDGRLMLAVLPFENLGTLEDEYFADGISEEIRSRLAMLDGLGVISRTTARQFKTDRPPLPEIARELKVDYVVEGSVRWQPGLGGARQVRVSPQLIRVSEDKQVWTESYTSEPSDIFEIQTDIAQRVAEELDLEILDPQRKMLARKRTDSVEAYAAYLQAEELFESGKELESLEPVVAAIEFYENAVTLDPAFAVVHARLAEAHGYLHFYGLNRTDERLQAGQLAATRALELAPDSPDAHYAQGLVHAAAREIPAAIAEYELVTKRWPNYAQAFWILSLFNTFSGQWDVALEYAIKAATLNPRAARHLCQVGGMNVAMGNYEEAIGHHLAAIAVTPQRACPYYCVLEATVSMGDIERAARFVAELPAGIDIDENPGIGFHWVRLDVIQEHYEEGLARLDSGPAEAYEAAWMYVPKSLLAAQIHELQGNTEDAKAGYEAARQHLEPLVERLPFDPRYRGSLAIAYGGLGRREDAIRQEEASLPILERGSIAKPFAIREFAHARVLIGDYDEAVGLLRQHLEMSHFLGADYLKIYPTWDPLRDRPDFQTLIEQYGSAESPSEA